MRGLEVDYFDDLTITRTPKKPLDCLMSFERFEIETNDSIKTFFFINTSKGFNKYRDENKIKEFSPKSDRNKMKEIKDMH